MLNIAAEGRQDGCVREWPREQQELLSLTSTSYCSHATHWGMEREWWCRDVGRCGG